MDNTRRTLLGLIFLVLIGLLVSVILQLLWNTERLAEESADATRTLLAQTIAAITATADIIPTPTEFVPKSTPEPPPSNFDSLLEIAHSWPLFTYEPFDNNLRGWSVGDSGTYSLGTRQITDGHYRWELTAIEGFVWWTAPINVPFEDFYASVVIDKQDRSAGDTSIVFRYTDGDNYYEFGLCDDVGQYRVFKETDGTRTRVVACADHPAINSAERNTLSVLAQANRYLFFINGQYVNTLNDSDLKRGGVGVGLDMDEGQANIFEFDDMVVRSAEIDP